MAKKNHIIKCRMSVEEIQLLVRAIERYNSKAFGQISLSDLLRQGVKQLANQILLAKEIKIVGLEK